MLLHELGHVQHDQRVFVPEEELGERLGQLGLTDAGRTGEDERTTRTARVLQTGARAADRPGQALDGVVLTDDALVQLVLHAEQALRLLLGQLEDRDAGGRREDLGDELLGDLGDDVHVAGLPLLLAPVALELELLLLVAEGRRLLEVLRVDRGLLVAAHLGDLLVELAEVRRRGHAADAHARAGLVDEVDRLVRQEAVADVAVGQLGRRHQGRVGDRHAVVGLVAVAQTLEDLDRVAERGLGHLDRLEPALQRGVLLEVLAVLVERGRADGLQLAPGQHRLQDAGGVDRALGGTRTDQRVELVDEQDDVAARADLLEHLLQALLEVTAVAGTGDQRAQVEGVELLVLEGLGHLALDDLLGQALDNGGLADAGLADQDGVVLGPAGQDLHDPLDLLVAPDHRVELALAGGLGQVAAKLVQHKRGRRGRLLRATGRRGLLALVAVEQLDDLLPDAVEVGAKLHQHLSGHALALTDEAEEDVLGADVVVTQLQGLAERQLKDLLGARGERNVPRRRRLPLADDLLDLLAHTLKTDAQALKCLGGHAFALMDQAKKNVLSADVVVVEHPGLFLGQDDNPPCAVSEPFEHLVAPSQSGQAARDIRARRIRMLAPTGDRSIQETFPESRAFTLHPTTVGGSHVPTTPQANDV